MPLPTHHHHRTRLPPTSCHIYRLSHHHHTPQLWVHNTTAPLPHPTATHCIPAYHTAPPHPTVANTLHTIPGLKHTAHHPTEAHTAPDCHPHPIHHRPHCTAPHSSTAPWDQEKYDRVTNTTKHLKPSPCPPTPAYTTPHRHCPRLRIIYEWKHSYRSEFIDAGCGLPELWLEAIQLECSLVRCTACRDGSHECSPIRMRHIGIHMSLGVLEVFTAQA